MPRRSDHGRRRARRDKRRRAPDPLAGSASLSWPVCGPATAVGRHDPADALTDDLAQARGPEMSFSVSREPGSSSGPRTTSSISYRSIPAECRVYASPGYKSIATTRPLGGAAPARRARCGDLAPPLRNRWFADSPLEGTGFEPSVPLLRRLSSGRCQSETAARKGGATYRFRSETAMLAWSGSSRREKCVRFL